MKDISSRKSDHIDIVLNRPSQHMKSTGLEKYDFIHKAIPGIRLDDVDTSVDFLGKRLAAPFIISGMTGGTPESRRINLCLAEAAQRVGVAFGVGSQRSAIENPSAADTFKVRHAAQSIPVLANLGAVQLNYGYGLKECQMAVDMIDADALCLHLNSLQEVIQEGETDFSGLIPKIGKICEGLSVPVIVKEVGFGIDRETAQSLADAGVHAIDVSGAGGTSWSLVESHRASPRLKEVGTTFKDWGITTSECIVMNKGISCALIAGGGIRTGLDVAKSIALGADMASGAFMLVEPAAVSTQKVVERLETIILELRTAMFCIGARDIAELKRTARIARTA